MKDLSPLQLLDIILGTLNTISLANKNEIKQKIRHFELLRIIESNNYKVDENDFGLALEKLINDRYVKNIRGYESSLESPFEEKEYLYYSITFEGRIFCLQNGYTQEAFHQSSENVRISKIDKAQSEFRLIQNILLILVALGTIVAAVYYLIEIGKYLHWWK